MRASVQPLEGELRDGAIRLRTTAYPDRKELLDVDRYLHIWRWLETHPLAGEAHRWALTVDDTVMGVLAAVPQYYRIDGQRVVAHTPMDYMVHPQYGFHGLSLMREFFRTCPNCVTCDQLEAPVEVEKRLGRVEEVAKLRYAVKLLDAPGRARSLPASARRLLNGGFRVADAALTSSFGSSQEVEVLEGFDERFDSLFERVAASVPCLPEKDAAFLRWRYGPGSPQSPVTILGVSDGESLLGYAVLRVTSNGENGYVLDLTTLPGHRNVAPALLREAVRHFRRANVPIIRYRFLESSVSPRLRDLGRMGFFFRKTMPHTLLVKFAEPSQQKSALDPARWAYNIGDGEPSFWVL